MVQHSIVVRVNDPRLDFDWGVAYRIWHTTFQKREVRVAKKVVRLMEVCSNELVLRDLVVPHMWLLLPDLLLCNIFPLFVAAYLFVLVFFLCLDLKDCDLLVI